MRRSHGNSSAFSNARGSASRLLPKSSPSTLRRNRSRRKWKGALAVRLAHYFAVPPEIVVAAIIAVIVGHNWPIQLRFHGGKGIATSLGALLLYDSLIVLVLVGLLIPLFALIRNFTLSGLLAFALAPLILFVYGSPNEAIAAISFIAIIVLISHRKNIREEIMRVFTPVKESPNHPPDHQK